MADVLNHPNPLDLYVEAYGSFQFSSHSKVILEDQGQTETLEGRSFLEQDEQGNFHLVRVPLSSDFPVEVVYVKGKLYLRIGKESDFRVVRHQEEFDRWAGKTIKEILSLYSKLGFDGSGNATFKGSLMCWTSKNTSLCADPSTGLPVEGFVKTEPTSPKNQPIPEIRFSMVSASHRKLVVTPPENVRKEADS